LRCVDDETGKPFNLNPTPELEEERGQAYKQFQCDCANTEVRRRVVAGGGVQFTRQCLSCGKGVGGAIAKHAIQGNPPDWNETLDQLWQDHHESQRDAIIQRHIIRQKQKDTSFYERHSKYTASPEWAALRKKVLRRAGGLCEGCGDSEPADVHHLTYKHFEKEFLFELVALCKPCHLRIHGDDDKRNLEHEELRDRFLTSDFGPPCDGCRYGCELECTKFGLPIWEALASDGPCGPKNAELEPLK
jgi:hypothetical protein